MRRELFSFHLPEHLIAQSPATDRSGARLLVVDAPSGGMEHRWIREIPEFLEPGTLVVPNDVKVRHARLLLRRSGGGEGEALLLRALPSGRFEAMVRPGAKLRPGRSAQILHPHSGSVIAEIQIEESLPEGLRRVWIHSEGRNLDWEEVDRIGRLPLPPYIHHLPNASDEDRYQTIFAQDGEAVAAPTAGLHFTPELIQALRDRGCDWHPLRLHVGLGTFRPMTAEEIEDHVMHEERFEIPEDTAQHLENALGKGQPPILAIGTTALRSLETAWNGQNLDRAGVSRLFIKPGYQVKTAQHLLTNFHLPESTLFVLVCSLLGMELAHSAYAEAIREEYRFFSYGDAMLLRRIQG